MTTELAGVIATALVRIAFAFLPISLKNFSFNADQAIEAEEAINANVSRILLVTWWPTTLAVSSAIAATKGRDTIRYIPFLIALLACVSIFMLVWRHVPLRLLRSGISAKAIAAVLSVSDLCYFVFAQERVVDIFLSSSATASEPNISKTVRNAPGIQPSAVDAGID